MLTSILHYIYICSLYAAECRRREPNHQQTMQKRKSMDVNSSSNARDRTASRLELPNNLRRAPFNTTGFCTPDVGPLRPMQNVNHGRATTSMVTERKPLVQNSKIPERQTILRPEPATTCVTPALPPPARAAQNPGGELCAARHVGNSFGRSISSWMNSWTCHNEPFSKFKPFPTQSEWDGSRLTWWVCTCQFDDTRIHEFW